MDTCELTEFKEAALYNIGTTKEINGRALEEFVALKSTDKFRLPVGPFYYDYNRFLEVAKPHTLTREMTPSEYATLKETISVHGILESVTIDLSGNIIDGYHRVRAACDIFRDTGEAIPVPYQLVSFKSSQTELLYVALKNSARRQMSISDKRAFATQLLLHGHKGTDAYIATLSGLARPEPVCKIRKALEAKGAIPFLEIRIDKRGHKWDMTLEPVAETPGEESFKIASAVSEASDRTLIQETIRDLLHKLWSSSDGGIRPRSFMELYRILVKDPVGEISNELVNLIKEELVSVSQAPSGPYRFVIHKLEGHDFPIYQILPRDWDFDGPSGWISLPTTPYNRE